jgi:hypothetical protein
MTRYLDRAAAVRDKYAQLGLAMSAAENQVSATPDGKWGSAGREIGKLAKRLSGVETQWTHITPPKGLAAGHRAYGNSIDLNRKYWELASCCLVNGYDLSVDSVYGKQLTDLNKKANTAFDTYRTAVTLRASRLGVEVPWNWYGG